MTSLPNESDLLTEFERDNLPQSFKEYYSAKRRNFFASIQQFAPVWKCFVSLDQIWFREFEDMKVARDEDKEKTRQQIIVKFKIQRPGPVAG